MRPIKFRQAIFKDNKFHHWHYWGFCGYRDEFVSPIRISPMGSSVVSTGYDVKESQQYIGLRCGPVSVGEEIYEGDIVSHPLCVKEPHDEEPCETFIGHIQFEVDRGQYFAVNTQMNGYVVVMSEAYKFEVIGNIHENKEKDDQD